ncbi:MAG: PH domain-containing protein [Burkholderiales bacterium]|nr:PH domain-containing protein [Burkholderiales bacterium]
MTQTPDTAPAVIFTGTPRRAAFNPLIRPYMLITIGFTLIVTIIGIPLAIIWFLGGGQWWTRHYFDRLDCTLDDKVLRFRKGILFQVEKTIPLENIQDVAFIEGPLLRHFNLSTLKFETAGSSHGEAANMMLTGIIDAHDFRNEIMARRDALKSRSASVNVSAADAQLAVLQDISAKLDQLLALARENQTKP